MITSFASSPTLYDLLSNIINIICPSNWLRSHPVEIPSLPNFLSSRNSTPKLPLLYHFPPRVAPLHLFKLAQCLREGRLASLVDDFTFASCPSSSFQCSYGAIDILLPFPQTLRRTT